MKKKIFLLAISAVLTNSIFAVKSMAAAEENDNFSGFYLGVGALQANLNATTEITDTTYSMGAPSFLLENGFDAWGGRLFAGYGKTFKPVYLGLEAAYQYIPKKAGEIRQNIAYYGIEGFTAKHTGSLSAKGGYVINDNIMPYIAIGLTATSFKFNVLDNSTTPIMKHRLSQTLCGITPGLGMQYMFNHNAGLDLRYTYTAYAASSMQKLSDVYNDTDEARLTPKTSITSLNLIYHF